MRFTGGVLTFLCAFSLVASAQAPPGRIPQMPGETSASTQPVSDTTMVTWFARKGADDVRRFELLVLWRGTPRWYLRGASSGSGGGSANSLYSTARYGETDLQVEFDTKARVVRVQGMRVEMHDNNVILVDDVAGPGRAKVAGIMKIDLAAPQPGAHPRAGSVLSKSPEVLAFIGCDAEAKTLATPDRWCEQLRVK